jgi:Kelch motif
MDHGLFKGVTRHNSLRNSVSEASFVTFDDKTSVVTLRASWRAYRPGTIIPRYNHTANAIAGNSGGIFMFGGSAMGSASDDFFRLDVSHLEEEPPGLRVDNSLQAGTKPSPRHSAASCLVGDDFICIYISEMISH